MAKASGRAIPLGLLGSLIGASTGIVGGMFEGVPGVAVFALIRFAEGV